MRRIFLAITLAFCTLSLMAADKYEYNDYYYQRKSLFEELPVAKCDVVFLGNSLTNNGHWHELFPTVSVRNRGIISDVIQGISDRVELVTAGHPRKIFLLVGVNDISHHVTADSLAIALEKLVVKIKEQSPETKLFLQSLLPINNDFHRYRNLKGTEPVFPRANKLFEEMAKRQNITWLNIAPAFANEEGKLIKEITSDGLHVNAEGYKIWRKQVAKYVDADFIVPEEVYTLDEDDIVFVGGSLINGCEWNELFNSNLVKKRIWGDVVTYYAANARKVAENKPGKMFVLSAYDNNSGDINGDTIVRKMEKTILAIKEVSPETQIYLQGLVPVNSSYEKYAGFAGKTHEIEQINARLRNLAKKNGAKWINLFPALADENGELKAEYTNDGFHLMGKGYMAWREVLLKYFK